MQGIACTVFVFCLFGCTGGAVSGATIVADSAKLQDVQAAVRRAADGDTVGVPAGTVTWRAPLVVDKAIELRGAGAGTTVIINPRTDWQQGLIYVVAHPGGAFRIDGFTFEGPASEMDSNHSDAIVLDGDTNAFRIDHNVFTDGGAHSIWIYGSIYGVIDHNTFTDPSDEVISIFDAGSGDASWNRPLNLGSPDAVYAEDNTFDFKTKGDHAITAVNGGRYVFRHNTVHSSATVNASQIDVHGNFFDARSARSFEVYDNILESDGSYQGMYIRGGSGVIFGNQFSGSFYHPIIFTQYRAFRVKSGTEPGYCGYTDCWHPSMGQIEDTYVWNNSYNGSKAVPWVDDRGVVRTVIRQGRDYFLSPKPGYKPYTYPDPLTQNHGGRLPSY